MSYKETYINYRTKINAYGYALWLISWDSQTETPSDAVKYQAQQIKVLSEAYYDLTMADERITAIEELLKVETDPLFKRELELEYKDIESSKKIPKEDYLEFRNLVVSTRPVYHHAKVNSDYESFKPYLHKIIEYNRKIVKLLETDKLKGYNVLLDRYEEGMGIKEYDKFFDTLKERLVPFIKKVREQNKDFTYIKDDAYFNPKVQEEYCLKLLDVVGYNSKRGVLKESLHPFTSGSSPFDVRITTNYHPRFLESSIFSALHEAGHGIYEQQVNDDYAGTAVGDIRSLGMHESQSRLYENLIGRSKVFWDTHYNELQQTFKEQLKDISKEQFYQYVNRVEPGFIRTEADELHYSIHVLIRYEIEKKIFEENLDLEQLPNLWNKLYKDYLGLDVPNDTLGILQDIHWSGGAFGYFPTYALGTAYSSQIFNKMQEEVNTNEAIKNNENHLINNWLEKHIHTHGNRYSPKELFKNEIKEEFNADYYVNYLIKKYSELYGVK